MVIAYHGQMDQVLVGQFLRICYDMIIFLNFAIMN